MAETRSRKIFVNLAVGDTAKQSEGLFALSCDSRAEVDEMWMDPKAGQ
ncbi:MAG: hypothetical protein H0X67_09370 [Acidobacteria bacterium]|nr:hypothetical protein [Acidobacteriota bacterium]